MSFKVLDQWDAIEIFSRTLCRIDKKLKLRDFNKNEVLMRELLKYSKGKLYESVSATVFGKKAGDKGLAIKRPKSFYELGRCIRSSLPVILEQDELDGYLKFIGLTEADFLLENSFQWLPSDIQRKLEGTEWVLYYFHQDTAEGNKKRNAVVSGIARAILKLKPFGKAEIVGFKESENYIGRFRMYGKEERFIHFEMRLKEYKAKDLSMLIYMGVGKPELALGSFHNLGRSIYSGTIMLEPLTTVSDAGIESKFFKNMEIKELPAYVQTYFRDKRKNILRVPCKVTSRSDFWEWCENKNGGSEFQIE